MNQRYKVNCPNMNHSRSNAPVRFCPSCGEKFSSTAPKVSCDEAKHASRRKDRNAFCHDCGKKLVGG
jgi:hypothetical protein